jgi:hypothetical protein
MEYRIRFRWWLLTEGIEMETENDLAQCIRVEERYHRGTDGRAMT